MQSTANLGTAQAPRYFRRSSQQRLGDKALVVNVELLTPAERTDHADNALLVVKQRCGDRVDAGHEVAFDARAAMPACLLQQLLNAGPGLGWTKSLHFCVEQSRN